MESTTEQGESRMLDDFTFPAARDLATARPDVMVFGCTSAGALRGNPYDAWLTREIEQRTGIKTVSVIKSVREKIQTLAVKRLVVATPYIQALNKRIARSLQDDGLEVLQITGLGIEVNFEIAQVTQQEILELAIRAVGGHEPELLFLSCTNFPAMNSLSAVRELFPFPVISSNQVTLEAAILAAQDRG